MWKVLHQKVVDHREASVGPLTDGQHIAEGAIQCGHLSNVTTLYVLSSTALT